MKCNLQSYLSLLVNTLEPLSFTDIAVLTGFQQMYASFTQKCCAHSPIIRDPFLQL